MIIPGMQKKSDDKEVVWLIKETFEQKLEGDEGLDHIEL